MSGIANPDQHDAWNGESGTRWVAQADERDRVLQPVADALLRAAALTPGTTVLDVGCGCGATTLSAGRQVGDAGHATGLDLSSVMLRVARSRASAAGAANVTFVAGDAQTHRLDERVEVVVSRFGTMFFGDPAAAFANLGATLAPGGRLCLATWRSLEANDWLRVPGAALAPFAGPPEDLSGGPGMFAQSDPDVVRATLTEAGFHDVQIDPVSVEFAIGATVEEAAAYLADTGPLRLALGAVPHDRLDRARAALRAALEDHVVDSEVRLDGAIWLVRGTMVPAGHR